MRWLLTTRSIRKLAILLAGCLSLIAHAGVPKHPSDLLPDWDFDGNRVLGHLGSDVCLWNTRTGQLLLRLPGNRDAVRSVQLSPDGNQAVSSSSSELGFPSDHSSVQVWDLVTGRQIVEFDHQSSPQFFPDGKRILTLDPSGPSGAVATVWKIKTGEPLLKVNLGDYRCGYDELTLTPDGNSFAVFSQSFVETFDATTGKSIRRINLSNVLPQGFRFDSQSRRLLTFAIPGIKPGVDIFDLDSGNLLHRLSNAGAGYADFTHDGQRLVSTDGHSVKVFNTSNGGLLWTLPQPGNALRIVVSPDDHRCLVTWGDETGFFPIGVSLWDLDSGGLIAQWHDPFATSFSPDSQSVLSIGNSLTTYNANTGALVRQVPLACHCKDILLRTTH